MQKVFDDDFCECAVCVDDADVTLEEAGCKFAGTDPHARWLYSEYQTYVGDGNVPLTDLPPWFADVGRLVAFYRGRQQRQKRKRRKQRKRARKLQKRHGFT